MTLTKDRLINSTCKSTSLNKARSKDAVEAVFEILKENLECGEDVLISGFGKFCVKKTQEDRDSALGNRRVVFKCSPKLRDKINGG